MLNPKQISKVRSQFSGVEQDLAAVFKVLSDITRCRIFKSLVKEQRLSAGDIAKILKISMPLASQHLKILVHSGLLTRQREGRRIYFQLQHQNKIVKLIINALNAK